MEGIPGWSDNCTSGQATLPSALTRWTEEAKLLDEGSMHQLLCSECLLRFIFSS